MDRYAEVQKYQVITTCSYVRSNARDRRPASAARSARRRPCGWLALDAFYSAEELSYYERNQYWYIHRDYNRVVQTIIYAIRVLIPDQVVTPPLQGTSTPVKATCDERRPEQEPLESREELRVIHDNHCINDARASIDECINENYNPQREMSAPGVTHTKDRVLRDKTKARHGTPPKKNTSSGKPKDISATGTRMALLLQEAAIQSTMETISWYLQGCL
jgi:hypothetical protein